MKENETMATTEPCPKCGEEISTAYGAILHHCRVIETPPEIANKCVWEADEDGIWHASCDHTNQNLYCFNEDGPDANGFSFCPFCGRHLLEVKPMPEPTVDNRSI